MIRMKNGNFEIAPPAKFSYCPHSGFRGRMFLRLTRYLRAKNAARYVLSNEGPLLDVGCGDGYFLRYIQVSECYGFDEMFSDKWEDLVCFEDHYFSYITLLAVVEHLADAQVLNRHLWRILKPGGRLILTTPLRKAESFIRLYAPHVGEEHKHYYDLDSMNKLLGTKYALVDYRKFLFGMNQVFCFMRLP